MLVDWVYVAQNRISRVYLRGKEVDRAALRARWNHASMPAPTSPATIA